eukprot:6190515-Pleurochrysis_carterae.AAC.1
MREKELEKREAEYNALKAENTSLQGALQAKEAQLSQAAELLRNSNRERDRSRADAEKAAAEVKQLIQSAAAAAKDAAASS